MKRFVAALALGGVLSLVPAAVEASESPQPEPEIAVCEVVHVAGPTAQIQCRDILGNIIPAGQVNLPEVIEEVEVIVEEIVEVEVPGPTVTETIKPQPQPQPTATETVKVPGPTDTETVRVPVRVPSETETVYNRVDVPGPPGPTVTETVRGPVVVESRPGETETVTVTKEVEVEVDEPVDDSVLFDPPAIDSVPEAVGYSALALIALCGLIILGLWLGYILGYKDKERKEMKFLDALRDQFYYKGNHS